MNNFTQEALDFLKDIIVIVVIVMVIRTFLIMPFQINGKSMMESYYDGGFILVDRFSYRELPLFGQTREIQRGDVVVFAPGVSKDRKYFIKRVIALPGEEVKIESGKVYLKKIGEEEFIEIEESEYLSDENNKKTYVRGDDGTHIYSVPENRYFVLGDNRNHSSDSRNCFQNCNARGHYLSPEEILGNVLIDLGYFNFSSFSFTHPDLGISTKPRFFSSPGKYNY